jgi:predicted PurR-regulated permease PerM
MKANQNRTEQMLPPLWILVIASLYGIWWLVSELRELVVLLVIGYAVAFVFDPILDRLEAKKIPRSLGFALITSFFLISITLFAFVALPPLIEEGSHFLDNVPGYITIIVTRIEDLVFTLNKRLPFDHQITLNRDELMQYASLIDGQTIKRTLSALFSFLLEGYSITITILNLTLLPFIIYYLSIDIDSFHNWVLGLVPKSLKKNARAMFSEINFYLRAFIVGQTLVSLTMTVLYCIGFAIVGHAQWFLIGVVAGIGNIVPYLGTALGIVLGVTFSLTSDASVMMLLKTAIVFVVVQALEGTFITPKIVGDKVGLSPLLIILAILAAGKLFGLLGIFLAVPSAAAIRVIGSYFHRAVLMKAGEG